MINLEGNCRTTAMGVMPHTNADDALKLAFSLDIPYWPQLPLLDFTQDMYAQAAQNFPGITTGLKNNELAFDTTSFQEELWGYSEKMSNTDIFTMDGDYASVYQRFLQRELEGYPAIRGQSVGPVSLGFNVLDEERKPLIYNDEARALLFDFIRQKQNVQYQELRERNANAFVWLDEPGLNYVFSGLFAYSDRQAKEDYVALMQGLAGPKGLHLCPNVNLPYLLNLGAEILSFDAFQLGLMPREYARAAVDFLRQGNIISWGIVPTEAAALDNETPETLAGRLIDYWEVMAHPEMPVKQIARQALLAPARCSIRDLTQNRNRTEGGKLKASGLSESAETANVSRAFTYLRRVSSILKDRYDCS